MTEEQPRKLSRTETHDLSMIIEIAPRCCERMPRSRPRLAWRISRSKMATVYTFDQDEVWKKATREAQRVVRTARSDRQALQGAGNPAVVRAVDQRQLAGPRREHAGARRDELRRVAKASIDAMTKSAITKIEKQALDLRTQVVGMGLLSPDAKLFLESLAPVEELMRALDFGEIERKLEKEQQLRLADRRRLYGGD